MQDGIAQSQKTSRFKIIVSRFETIRKGTYPTTSFNSAWNASCTFVFSFALVIMCGILHTVHRLSYRVIGRPRQYHLQNFAFEHGVQILCNASLNLPSSLRSGTGEIDLLDQIPTNKNCSGFVQVPLIIFYPMLYLFH